MSWSFIMIHPGDGHRNPSTRRFDTEEEAVFFLALRRLEHADFWKGWAFEVVEYPDGKEVLHD